MSAKVCLVMIVKDESDVIERCLASVKPVIDRWLIVDTGSEDDTAHKATQTLRSIPGEVISREWVSHAFNREQAIEAARATIHAAGGLTGWYLLCLDADHILRYTEPPQLNLTHDIYTLRISSVGGEMTWRLPLLLKAEHHWLYEGAAHPLLNMDGCTIAPLDDLWIDSPAQGGSPEKFQRDAAALEAELNPRSIFYLAQTYRDLGHKREAADMYRLRVRLTAANPEEVFWACYQEGLLRLDIGERFQGIQVLLEAFERRPTRAEPLYALARHYRLTGFPNVALLYARRARPLLPPVGDSLFVLSWIYEWGVELEFALAALAAGYTDMGVGSLRGLDALHLEGEPGEFVADQLAKHGGEHGAD